MDHFNTWKLHSWNVKFAMSSVHLYFSDVVHNLHLSFKNWTETIFIPPVCSTYYLEIFCFLAAVFFFFYISSSSCLLIFIFKFEQKPRFVLKASYTSRFVWITYHLPNHLQQRIELTLTSCWQSRKDGGLENSSGTSEPSI